MAKILIVEDDLDIAHGILDYLKFEGHIVEHIADGGEAEHRLQISQFDLVILDWNLPSLSGIEILTNLRAAGVQTPVLMLTGKTPINDRTLGLYTGADDYLTKPFDMRELAARIAALLRRPPIVTQPLLVSGPISLDSAGKRCFRDGLEIKLLAQEYALLEFLLRHKGRTYTADELLSSIWRSDTESSTDAVRQCVTRLRKKLDLPGAASVITTVIGAGYKIDT